jgi:hypothetical protein
MRALRLLLLAIPPLLLLALLSPGGALPAATAGEEGDPPKAPAEEEDPFAEDEFDTPTSFSPEQVDKAIEKGVRYLRSKQLDDGSWGETTGNQAYGGGAVQGQAYGHPAGATALAVYTLLKCRAPLSDPAVKKGLEFLKKRHEKPGGSYETSMCLLAICATADATRSLKAAEKLKPKLSGAHRGWAQALLDRLLDKRTGRTWRYQVQGGGAPPGGENDLSSTQLAALALFSAHRMGLRAPDAVWNDILSFSLDQQDPDGPEVKQVDPITRQETTRRVRGFSYIRGQSHPEEGQPTGSMTACGVANLMMARFILSDAGRRQAEWNLRSDAKRVQDAVEDGIAWMEANWSPFANPKKKEMNVYHLYWLYAVERAMDLTGQTKVGPHIWYSEMGQQLIDRQGEDGRWDTQTAHQPGDVLDTCFGLLFLRRSTRGAIPFPAITGGSDEPPVDNR